MSHLAFQSLLIIDGVLYFELGNVQRPVMVWGSFTKHSSCGGHMWLHLPVLCGYCSAVFHSIPTLAFGLQTPWGMDVVLCLDLLQSNMYSFFLQLQRACDS